MTADQLTYVVILGAAVALPIAGCFALQFARWGVETGGYLHYCFTRKGAERLARYARSEGYGAEVVRLVRERGRTPRHPVGGLTHDR